MLLIFDIPPLRERMRDIPLLVGHFLDKHRYSPRSPAARITQDAADKLQAHDWPGNVRELENVIQRAVALSQGEVITEEHISFGARSSRAVFDVDEALRTGATLEEMMDKLRSEAIAAALSVNNHNLAKAAEMLNITLEELETYRASRLSGARKRS